MSREERYFLTYNLIWVIWLVLAAKFSLDALIANQMAINDISFLFRESGALLVVLMILIVLPVFSPIITELDFGGHVDKFEVVYWFAILMAVNLQTSFLTPPFGFALFYMKAVAPPEIKIQQIYAGIIPFVIIQLIGLGLVIAFPEIALWLPRQLLN